MLRKLIRVVIFSSISTAAAWTAGHLTQIAGPMAAAAWWPIAVPVINAALVAIDKWARAASGNGTL